MFAIKMRGQIPVVTVAETQEPILVMAALPMEPQQMTMQRARDLVAKLNDLFAAASAKPEPAIEPKQPSAAAEERAPEVEKPRKRRSSLP